MSANAYRTAVVVWSSEPSPRNTPHVAWMPESFNATIGKCTASITLRTPRGLPTYYRWTVSRGTHVTMVGSASGIDDAKEACERAAAFISDERWPTAFRAEGYVS